MYLNHYPIKLNASSGKQNIHTYIHIHIHTYTYTYTYKHIQIHTTTNTSVISSAELSCHQSSLLSVKMWF